MYLPPVGWQTGLLNMWKTFPLQTRNTAENSILSPDCTNSGSFLEVNLGIALYEQLEDLFPSQEINDFPFLRGVLIIQNGNLD